MTVTERELENGASDGEEHQISLCSLMVGTGLFGIDTSQIREVLRAPLVERVPLAPAFVAGVVPYRGDVLTTVSARALLGLPRVAGSSRVLILEGGSPESERFGLAVDRVGGVVVVDRRRLAANPSTLDDVGRALFLGAFRVDDGLLVQLDPRRLNPARLAETGLFASADQPAQSLADSAATVPGSTHGGDGDPMPGASEMIPEEK